MRGNNSTRYGGESSRGGGYAGVRAMGFNNAGDFGRGGSGYGGGGSSSHGGASSAYPSGDFSHNNARYGGGYGANRSYEKSYGGGRGGGRGHAGSGLAPVDWNRARLEPIKKNIYHESPTVANRPQHEIDQWITTNQVTLSGQNIPRPVFEFNEAGFPQAMVDLLYKNYDKPTTIQSISWPVALSGRDMISIAKTGSGKTLGFLLPGILHTISQRRRGPGDGPSVLVLLPTRELAQQVQEVAREYCSAMGLAFTCLFGGAPKHGQKSDLHRGVDVCIATPGRLLDFLEAGTTKMSACSFLVLDEADRMLDMGFEPQIRKIVSQIRPDRQTLMFSATWPKEVRALAADFQVEPVFLNVGSTELAANHNIQQVVEVMDEYNKQSRLFSILEELLNDADAKVIIFVETKRKADDLTRGMRRSGWPVMSIHGDKKQQERDWVLGEFKAGKTPILIATDVAARGLDVQNIKVVINYDYSNNSEDYVHRIGRTGRQNKKGVAYTFFTPQNAPKARDLIKILEEARQPVPPELQALSNSRGGPGGGRPRGGKRGYGGGSSDYTSSKRGRYENGSSSRW